MARQRLFEDLFVQYFSVPALDVAELQWLKSTMTQGSTLLVQAQWCGLHAVVEGVNARQHLSNQEDLFMTLRLAVLRK